jgi:hypothetical protein
MRTIVWILVAFVLVSAFGAMATQSKPEPGLMIFLGTVLLAVAAIVRRMRTV